MRGPATHELVILPRARRPRFGVYDVVTPLARGGMSSVYLAVHAETGERVALKVLEPRFANHPEVASRLFAEHHIAASVSHPGLVEIRDARLSSEQLPYLVMEYLDGETLAAAAERAPLSVPQIIAVAAQIASALAALHAAGIMHCDVKPENILLLDDQLRVKVIDFGVSRAVGEPLADGTIAGTPWCMAPEQWQGKPVAASDVYSLGCLLYDLITGAPPFDGSLPELMTAHLEQRPARPSWLAKMPIELERIILRALAKDPAERPTMAALAGELDALAAPAAAPALRVA